MIAPALQPLVDFFTSLTPASLTQMGQWYADDVQFKDPFNEVHGLAATRRIFEHMFEALQHPRFEVHEAFGEGKQALLVWTFHFDLRGHAMVIRGASHLAFNDQGRVSLHRDYWDAAEELYTKLPVLGTLMRFLQNKLRSKA